MIYFFCKDPMIEPALNEAKLLHGLKLNHEKKLMNSSLQMPNPYGISHRSHAHFLSLTHFYVFPPKATHTKHHFTFSDTFKSVSKWLMVQTLLCFFHKQEENGTCCWS